MRSAYKIAYQTTQEAQRLREIAHVEQRLREALALAGGVLREFQDRGDCWLVEWATPDGERHASAIHKDDLTVLGAGICLSGRDRDFDLQSLVGVVTQRFDPWD